MTLASGTAAETSVKHKLVEARGADFPGPADTNDRAKTWDALP